jgi:hypothetical protein
MDQSLDFKLTHYPNAGRARRHVGMARLAALKVTSLPLSLGISCQPWSGLALFLILWIVLWPALRLVGDFARFATPFALAVALIAIARMVLWSHGADDDPHGLWWHRRASSMRLLAAGMGINVYPSFRGIDHCAAG